MRSARVHRDVDHDPRSESQASRQQATRKIERHAIEMHAAQLTERRIDVCDECQRGEEMLAELPVCHPRLIGRQEAERQGVDEHRPSPDELNVVGTGVAQDQPTFESSPLNLEGEERGGLQLTEAPLEGVADERDRLRRDHRVGWRCVLETQRNLVARDEQPVSREFVEEP